MPLYDYECQTCGLVEEHIAAMNEEIVELTCGHPGWRIISISGVNTANQDADWIRSVCDVVDKDPSKPHCREFIKNPTRENYMKFLKGEGLRPMEPGEKPRRPAPVNESRLLKLGLESLRKRRRIEIGR